MQQPASHRRLLERLAREAMLFRGLEPEFPQEALQQAAALEGPAAAPPGARDLRELAWCSIDNDDSRDLDQLTASQVRDGGITRVLVAIADVDALVPKGSPLDRHALANTTSVYTAGRIFPMLPERLSTDLTSLNEHEDRIAVVTELDVAEDGSVKASSAYRAIVRNQAKLAYPSVGAWLEERGDLPAAAARVKGLADRLKEQDRAAQALRERRRDQGALDLETIEARAVFSGDEVVDLRAEATNRAKQLIEECMVAANGATAALLEKRGFASLRRVVRSPERWMSIVEVAAELGWKLPETPDSGALQEFLAARRKADPERFPDLSLEIVKLMGRGEYVVKHPGRSTPGHFGLAVTAYTHSTAPNRRYPDLVEQRLLKAALAGAASPYSDSELESVAQKCTEREEGATKVERQLRKSAGALVLSGRIGDRFDAIVTGASDKGTWVRIFAPPVEGMLVSGGRGLRVGKRLQVRLERTDVERGFIDFARA